MGLPAKDSANNSTGNQGNNGSIKGISIASFLQMLEQEKHSCKVHIQAGDRNGFLYFQDGDLIDAEYGNIKGIEAAYNIVSWDNPSIALNDSTSRPQLIDHPLGYILLNAAKKQDEHIDAVLTQLEIKYASDEIKNSSEFQEAVAVLSSINEIRYFYLLNNMGKLVVYSAPNADLGELIIYCIATSSHLKNTLQVKPPRRIHMQMQDGSSLLIIPTAGKILGMILEAHCSASEVAFLIKTGLSAL